MDEIGSDEIVLAYAFRVGCSRQAAAAAVGEEAPSVASAAASAARNESFELETMSMQDFESFEPTAEDWTTYEELLEDWLRRVHEVLWPELGNELDEALPADVADWSRRGAAA
jgi:hypothetical protein